MTTNRLLSTLALATLLAGAARGDLHCPQPTHDAGELRTGAPLRHRFVLSNPTGEAIEITGVKPGCGCLRPSVGQTRVPAGASTTVAIEVNTVTQAAGPNGWRVTVAYREAGETRQLPLAVTARLVRDVAIEPAALLLHTAAPLRAAFTLTETGEQPLAVRAAACTSPHLRLHPETPRRRADGWQRRIEVEVLPTLPPGRHEDVMVLYTGDPRCPELKAPLTVVKQSEARVQPSPEAVRLTASSGAALPARVVLLRGVDDTPVEVERTEPSHPCLQVTAARGPGPHSTLRVRVDETLLPPGPFAGSVRVLLRSPAGEPVTIPVHIHR